MNNLAFEVDAGSNPGSNRLYAPGDLAMSDAQRRMQYDAAGNLKRDTYTGAGDRSYDAENRMTKAWGGNSQLQEYTYNGDGQRVRRKVDSTTTWLVYGFSGELLAEYAANVSAASPQKEYGYRNGQLLITAVPQAPAPNTIGLYDPATSNFFLKNFNTPGNADYIVGYGVGGAGWLPLTGDWDRDGVDTIGLYDPASGIFFLKNANTPGNADLVFGFGPIGLGWVPLTGDWNGDGMDTIGFYDPASGIFYLKNTNSGGNADVTLAFGPGGMGWKPLAADWDGDGIDTIGLYDPASGNFFLKNTNTQGNADLVFGFLAGGSGWTPIAGDWNSDGLDTIGLYAPATGNFYLKNANAPGNADLVFGYGPGGLGWKPVTGNWGAGGAGSATNVQWLVTDQLGTPRLVIDKSGSLAGVRRHDYLPFGEELFAGTGQRTAAQGYRAGDEVRQRFTSKERDNETGLDYFISRYYSSIQGRFTSADSMGGDRYSPQSLNLYAYVVNNPLRFIDPLGYRAQDPADHPPEPEIDREDMVIVNIGKPPPRAQRSILDLPISAGRTFCIAGTCQGQTPRQLIRRAGRMLRGSASTAEAIARRLLPDIISVNGTVLWVFQPHFGFTVDGRAVGGIDTPVWGGWTDALADGIRGARTGKDLTVKSAFAISFTGTYILDPATRDSTFRFRTDDAADQARVDYAKGLNFGGTVCYVACGGVQRSSNGTYGVSTGLGTPGVTVGPSFDHASGYKVPMDKIPGWKLPE